MKASLFVLAIGVACVFGVPVELGEQWEMIPTADGDFKMVNVKEIEYLASLEPKADFPVRFYLYTSSNPSSPQEVVTGNSASLTSSYFSAGRPTRLVIHGWRNDGNSDVGKVVRQGYLNRGNFNVFVVDWGQGASSLNYATAKNNVADAGRKVAAFINFLNSHGAASSNIYVIGHSLGAHVSGFAGKYANSRPNTIYGMDAALPLFDINSPSGRLAVGDAGFVQTIHTDAGRLGFDRPLGDASFYPTWGNVQPGCGIDAAGSCSHSRSYQFLAESLKATNNFLGKNCGTYDDIKKKVCNGSVTAKMGGEPSVTSTRGVFYVPVNSNSPFATGRV